MSDRKKIRKDLKDYIQIQMMELDAALDYSLTYEDINAAIIDILHENSQHDAKRLFTDSYRRRMIEKNNLKPK